MLFRPTAVARTFWRQRQPTFRPRPRVGALPGATHEADAPHDGCPRPPVATHRDYLSSNRFILQGRPAVVAHCWRPLEEGNLVHVSPTSAPGSNLTAVDLHAPGAWGRCGRTCAGRSEPRQETVRQGGSGRRRRKAFCIGAYRPSHTSTRPCGTRPEQISRYR